jgi:ADP-ribose pyrophosphatase
VLEETGYSAGRVARLGGFYSAPGFCTEFLECFLLTDLSEGQSGGDEDENIEIERLTFEQALDSIRRGEIRDAKSIAGILMWHNLKRGA